MSNKMQISIGKSLRNALWPAVVLIITTVHHLYGAALYATPWRAHVAHPAVLTIAGITLMLFLFGLRPESLLGKISFWLAIALIVLVPVGLFGLFEGAYNHVLKDILYYFGTSSAVMDRLFPQPPYEMPDDLFFELTGILTFVVAIPAAYSVYRLFRLRNA